MRSPVFPLAIFCLLTGFVPTARATPLTAEQLTIGRASVPVLSTDVLLGGAANVPLRPTTAKRWRPSPVTARTVPSFWAVSPNGTAIASEASLPSITAANSSADTLPTLVGAQPPIVTSNLEDLASHSDTQSTDNPASSEVTEDQENTLLSQSLPPIQDIRRIQDDLQDINIPEAVRPRRTVFPGITISNPSGYGADRGQIFAGIGFQSRTRFSGGANPGAIFGGGARDGTAGIGFGIGNARESVGLQLSYTAASFGGSRAPLSGGLNAKVHKQFGKGWAAAVGGEGIINVGRLPEDDDQIEFNDFEGTYYGVVTTSIALREDFYSPFSRLTLTGGAGTGRFRSADQIANGEFGVGPFGSAALQIFPSTSLITEWTGQDLAVGVSVAPFRHFPIVFTPAIRDIAGESDGDPRFVLGVGVSLSDIFSKLGL